MICIERNDHRILAILWHVLHVASGCQVIPTSQGFAGSAVLDDPWQSYIDAALYVASTRTPIGIFLLQRTYYRKIFNQTVTCSNSSIAVSAAAAAAAAAAAYAAAAAAAAAAIALIQQASGAYSGAVYSYRNLRCVIYTRAPEGTTRHQTPPSSIHGLQPDLFSLITIIAGAAWSPAIRRGISDTLHACNHHARWRLTQSLSCC
jgi:hypothetical protein